MVRERDLKLIHPSGFTNQTFQGAPLFQLYDLARDPREENDLAKQRPTDVARLKSIYDRWYDDVMTTVLASPPPPDIIIDPAHENPAVLTWQERVADRWIPRSVGYWKLNFAETGLFDIQVDMPGEYSPRGDWKLMLTVGDQSYVRAVSAGTPTVLFSSLEIAQGKALLRANLVLPDGSQEGGYQVRVTRR